MRKVLATALVGVLLSGGAEAATYGLAGEFWDTGGLGNLAAAEAAMAARPADRTFVATSLDYPRGGAGSISDGATLAAFLADDAASLSGSGAATLGGSVFRFTGFIALDGLAHDFAVGSDDGFRLTIGGDTIAEHAGLRPFRTTVASAAPGAGWAPIELIYFENFGNTGVEFRLDGDIVSGARIATEAPPAAIPLPATVTLLVGGLAALAAVSARRRARAG